MKNIALISAITIILISIPACRIFRAEEWSRRDECAKTLPVLRHAPNREYRRIQAIKNSSEDGLAWEACGLGADAVLLEDQGDMVRATRNVKGIAVRWVSVDK